MGGTSTSGEDQSAVKPPPTEEATKPPPTEGAALTQTASPVTPAVTPVAASTAPASNYADMMKNAYALKGLTAGTGQDVGAGEDTDGPDPNQPQPNPGQWHPPGSSVPQDAWSYDLSNGAWGSPGSGGDVGGTQVSMGSAFNPQQRGAGMSIQMHPPGVPAPIGEMNWTPATGEMHPPGQQAPIHEANYSVASI